MSERLELRMPAADKLVFDWLADCHDATRKAVSIAEGQALAGRIKALVERERAAALEEAAGVVDALTAPDHPARIAYWTAYGEGQDAASEAIRALKDRGDE